MKLTQFKKVKKKGKKKREVVTIIDGEKTLDELGVRDEDTLYVYKRDVPLT